MVRQQCKHRLCWAGMEFLWKVALEADLLKVSNEAGRALVELILRLGPKLAQDKAAVRSQFIRCAPLTQLAIPKLLPPRFQAWLALTCSPSMCMSQCTSHGVTTATITADVKPAAHPRTSVMTACSACQPAMAKAISSLCKCSPSDKAQAS